MPISQQGRIGSSSTIRTRSPGSTGCANVTGGGWHRRADAFVVKEADIAPNAMPGTDGKWATTRFVDPEDVRHDMHVNIVTFQPGAVIPFLETHVMEHGLYVLEGKAVYRLNQDWVEVEAGDFVASGVLSASLLRRGSGTVSISAL